MYPIFGYSSYFRLIYRHLQIQFILKLFLSLVLFKITNEMVSRMCKYRQNFLLSLVLRNEKKNHFWKKEKCFELQYIKYIFYRITFSSFSLVDSKNLSDISISINEIEAEFPANIPQIPKTQYHSKYKILVTQIQR